MKWFLIFATMLTLIAAGCSNSLDETVATGDLTVMASSASMPTLYVEGPEPLAEVAEIQPDNIFLTVLKVMVQKDDSSWITVSEPNETIDFLDLLDTTMIQLADSVVPVGHYSQLRLLLDESSAIVIDGETHSLKVPSGPQTGLKLNLDFNVEGGETVTAYIDFDVNTEILFTKNSYIMKPTHKVVIEIVS